MSLHPVIRCALHRVAFPLRMYSMNDELRDHYRLQHAQSAAIIQYEFMLKAALEGRSAMFTLEDEA